jgi:uncharacterized protein
MNKFNPCWPALKFASSLLFLMVFSACSSQPAKQSQFYLLNKVPTSNHAVPPQGELAGAAIAYTLEIRLPDYLKRSNLVMQLSDHQLHYAQFARWAEDLEAGIRKVLASEAAPHHIILTGDYPTFAPQPRLVVDIEHFYPTEQGKVFLAGRYWTVEINQSGPYQRHEFFLQEKQEKDGYEQAVIQMRSLLASLSQSLIDHLKSASSQGTP